MNRFQDIQERRQAMRSPYRLRGTRRETSTRSEAADIRSRTPLDRRRVSVWVLALVAAWSLNGLRAEAQAVPLTLDDCVRLAFDAASTVSLARLDRDIADAGRVAARSGFLPQGAFSVDHIYDSPSRRDAATASFISSNAIREFAALATVVEEIDSSGRIRADYQRARANQDLTGANLAVAERDLKRGVAAAYYRLLLSRRFVDVLQATVDEAADFEDRATLLMQSGEVARADVVKAMTQTALFRQALSAAQLTADLANQDLASFWTDDVATRLDVVDVLDEPVSAPLPAAPQPQPYLARPEFRVFDAEQRAFEADARRARSGLLPQTQIAFQWGVDQSLPGLSFRDRGYAVFASVSFKLFDWSRSTSQIRQAEARAAQVGDTRAIASRQFSREYQSALTRVRGVYEQISLARIQATAAEEDLRLSRVRYEGGEGPALDVVVAQKQLADARSGYYAAITDYLNAQRDFEVASGQ